MDFPYVEVSLTYSMSQRSFEPNDELDSMIKSIARMHNGEFKSSRYHSWAWERELTFNFHDLQVVRNFLNKIKTLKSVKRVWCKNHFDSVQYYNDYIYYRKDHQQITS